MQTILKIVCGNRSLAHMVDDFIARFCEKATCDDAAIDVPSPKSDDVAFVKDDSAELEVARAAGNLSKLGSFGLPPNQVNEDTKFIFVNPLILSFRPNRHRLCVWIAGPSGTAGDMESE